MIPVVRERLERPDARAGFVLDGFPRTVAQAEALDSFMDGRGPLIVVDIVVPEAEIVRRLGSRMICADCGANRPAALPSRRSAVADNVTRGRRATGAAAEAVAAVSALAESERCRRCGGRLVQRADDSDAVVLERLKVYHRQTEPLVQYYRHRPTFRSVNGAQLPDQVAEALARAIDGAHLGGHGIGWKRAAVIVCRSKTELERMRAAGRLVGEVLTGAGGARGARASAPGISTRWRKRESSRRGRRRRSRGITGIRRRFARRSTTRSFTAFPRGAGCCARATSCRSTSARRWTGISATARITLAGRPGLRGGRDAAAGHRGVAVQGDRARAAGRTGFRSRPRRAAARRGIRVRGGARNSSGTASASGCTKSRRCPTTASRGAGRG